MAARGAEATAAVRPLARPRDNLTVGLAARQRRYDPDRLERRVFRGEANVVVELFFHLERLEPAGNWVVRRPALHFALHRSNCRVPLALAVALPLKVAAAPVEHLLGILLWGERRKVERQKAAAALHLFFHESHAFLARQVWGLGILVAVAAVGDHHDR